MATTTPRPILKRTTSSSSSEKHAVHFPPATALTRTFTAHSAAAYDRSPIVVAPNTCALPKRGDRTYILDDSPYTSSSRNKSSLMHPRAIKPAAAPPHMPVMPSLIPDLSSESDESDNFPSPHLENQEFCFDAINPHGFKSDDVLAFLPYAPSLAYQSSNEEDTHSQKPRRRSERRNEASRDNDRIRNSHVPVEEPNYSLRKSSKPRSSCIQPSTTSLLDPSSSISDSFSGFTLRDDGCLGGF